MDFISPILTPIVDSLLVPIKKHLGFLVSSTKYVRYMNTKMDQLNITEQDIQEKKKTAAALNHEISRHVSPWLEEVKNMKEKVESIPTGGIGCFSPVKRYKAGKESYALLEQMKDLTNRGSKIIWTDQQKPLARVPSTFTPVSSDTQNNFESRDLIFKNALKALQSNNVSEKMIALCGMGGVGKTTMMEQLLKVVKDSKMFDWVVKVVLGEEADSISLQQAIAQYIGHDLTETTKDARADRLRERFMGMSEGGKKKVLIIMDDVWEQVDLQDIGLTYPLPNGYNLLITSRSESVCTQMGVKPISIFKVHVLSVAEAQQLFFQIVELDGNDHDLQKIGEAIVRKCGGLPIAIVTIAKVLRSNIKEKWIEILSNLQQHDLQDLQSIVHRIFKISYDNLETEDDKALFLLSGLFPEDSNISIEDLMTYGWGLKLFTNVHTLARARRRTNICVNNLVSANLLTKGKSIGCVKLHDLVRAFILSNFTEVKQASLANQDSMALKRLAEDKNEPYQRILLKCTNAFEFSTNITYHDRLSLLILMGQYNLLKLPRDLFERMKKLEVLSFYDMRISLLPRALIPPTKLRTLCLHSCTLVNDEIYHIGSLINLETLSFASCNIGRLPSAIGKLKNLKSLDLTNCVYLCIEDGVFKNLKSLEELYMRGHRIVSIQDGAFRFTTANCEELKILSQRLSTLELQFFDNNAQPRHVSFKTLERFKISIGCELGIDSFGNTLHLVAECEVLKECNISDLFKETEELHLQVNDMYHLQDVSMDHTFSQLRDLYISKCEKLTDLFTFDVASGLNKLERLTVFRCPVLRTLVGEKVGVISFPKLSFMSLGGLPEMISLCDDMIRLPALLEMKLDGLPNFTSVYSDSNNICSMQTLLNEEVVIPKLEILYISDMENLKQIWPFENSTADKNIDSMLQKINIKKCISLVNLFSSNPLPLLNHLEELVVEECGSLEVLFNIDFKHVCETEGYNSRLRSIEVDRLGKLKELWRIRSVNSSDIHINVFKSLETIRIRGCRSFTYLFTPTITKFDLGSLTTYVTDRIGKKIGHDKSKRQITKMDNLIYPSYLLHMCHHLQELHLDTDRRVGEVVFEMDNTPNSSTQLPTTIQSPLLLLSYLERLSLTHLNEIRHVWKCNWNTFTIPQHQAIQMPFQNLAKINLRNCHKVKYLFSPLMAKYLSNLKKVDISWCNGIEEVISSRDDEYEENTTSTSSNQKITFFPHLDTLALNGLRRLESVDGFKSAQVIRASWSFCQYPRKIAIADCDTLGSMVPWYATGQMKKLNQLELRYCKGMTEVFESGSISYNTNDVDEGSASNVKAGTTLTRSTLRNITAVVVPQLSNLKILLISGCERLSHIFTFSTLESLKQLKTLEVKNCKAVQMIVKEEKGASSKVVVFSHLETLILDGLPNLKGFFFGVNDFQWPSLHNVMIHDCSQLIMLTVGQSKAQKLKYIRTRLEIYNVESCGLNFQTAFSTSSDATISKEMPFSFLNLAAINIVEKYNGTCIFPSHALLQLQKLEKITAKNCDGVKEVFQVESEGINGSGLNESETTTIVKISNLIQVELAWLADLKYLWKSYQWMVLEFPNLRTLSIDWCVKLKHVFTCSMVSSLVQLQDLRIRDCDKIEVIVKKEKEQEQEQRDAKVNEVIMLPRLKSLELEVLSSLKGFCIGNEAFSFPALDTLKILGCREITVFTKGHSTTPKLKVITTSFGLYDVGGDINSFIETKKSRGE